MQVLAIERSLKPLDRIRDADLLRQEAVRVWALQKQGVIRRLWFTRGARDAVVLLECGSLAKAEALLARMPLVRSGHSTFALLPLVAYDGFERLFAGGQPQQPGDPTRRHLPAGRRRRP